MGGGGGRREVCVRVSGGRWLVRLAAEHHRAAVRSDCAAGAGLSRPWSPGRRRQWGGCGRPWDPHPSAGTNPAEHHPRGRILVEPGGAPRHPLAAEPDRDGPRRRDPGGAGGAGHRGSGARGPGVRGPARARPGGPLGCGWRRRGVGGRGGSGPNPERPSGVGRGRPLPGGGGCSLPGG